MSDAAEKAAKLSDVARAAGVSQGTVSNVFSRPQVVRPEVREHVHEVARQEAVIAGSRPAPPQPTGSSQPAYHAMVRAPP